MATATHQPTTEFEKKDRCSHLDHRPRVLLAKIGLDGHDRGVKVISRALRDSGVHVIYSGLWQTPQALAIGARDEDCDLIAASMMSNSHLVLIPRLIACCKESGRPDIPIDVGGIIPQEDVQTLLDAGVHRIFHTGTGLEAIVEAVCDVVHPHEPTVPDGHTTAQLARDLSLAFGERPLRADAPRKRPMQVIGLTGSPGAGKSTLVAALAAEYVRRDISERLAVIAIDPMSPITQGALLGDRLRVDFNSIGDRLYYRSIAITGEDYRSLPDLIELIGGAGFDRLIIETVGAGQNDVAIREYVDQTIVVLVPGMGDSTQMDKAGILEIADLFVCNKADHEGESHLVRHLSEVAGRRPIVETIATRGQGIDELLDVLLA
ncbi:MAG: cobalamin-dependent protein [Phycisphaerales bacterium]|nr:cobalamin-dependent protein [Phycisphaerales bacterium]